LPDGQGFDRFRPLLVQKLPGRLRIDVAVIGHVANVLWWQSAAGGDDGPWRIVLAGGQWNGARA
jgi:hypothetical protein